MSQLIETDDNILVFGGSGFLGSELLRDLDRRGPRNITIFGRDDGKLTEAKQEYPHLTIIQGDIAETFKD